MERIRSVVRARLSLGQTCWWKKWRSSWGWWSIRLSHYLQGFMHPRWLSPDFWTINSILNRYLNTVDSRRAIVIITPRMMTILILIVYSNLYFTTWSSIKHTQAGFWMTWLSHSLALFNKANLTHPVPSCDVRNDVSWIWESVCFLDPKRIILQIQGSTKNPKMFELRTQG